ncbi:dipicolinate synthase subunit DpsA [Schnuerera sp. xch1]|uniref:dipicolinate synthase subunit DpsA n=1 Tax=Schnuerera sp. xch1 TaxID=2874283 RepID=UPI001CBC5832|nr:dipicolinate synthase subunit DpsA [Schnuerera sp. xch1]MBZ2174771.1 dipicolinate synthase subunit DpsA [Schnuerera sp. xch1]
MKKKNFMVLGGDERNLELASLLDKDGHNVLKSHIHGLDFRNSEIIIGPLPLSYDNKTLNAHFHDKKISIETVLEKIDSNQPFIAGKINDNHILKAKEYGITIIDYFKREEMQILNAIPTAEGAIKIALERMPITLHSSNALVLGFGRIGKTLASMLYGIGANVYVAARKYSDMAWIRSLRYTPILLRELDRHIHDMDVVFNTIPSLVLNKDTLSHIKKETLVIDVASKPGGVDFDVADKLGIKTIHALGLPGKIAPVTAAMVIKETIYNIIEERGI